MRSLRPALAVFCAALLCPVPSNASDRPELQWDPPAYGVASGYLVWSGTAPGAYSESIDVGLATAYSLPSLSEGTTYYFAVQAYDADNQLGALSTEVSHTTIPAAPANLAAGVRTRGRIDLNWKAPGGTVSGYRVEVGSAVGASDVATITTGTVPSLSIRSLPPRTYYVRVRSINSGGVSAPGNEVAATLVAAPPPPSTLVAAIRRRRLIDLSWEAPTPGVLAYRLEVGTAPGRSDVRRVDTSETAMRLDDLASGVYYIRVRSVGVGGMSSPSNEVVVEVIRQLPSTESVTSAVAVAIIPEIQKEKG